MTDLRKTPYNLHRSQTTRFPAAPFSSAETSHQATPPPSSSGNEHTLPPETVELKGISEQSPIATPGGICTSQPDSSNAEVLSSESGAEPNKSAWAQAPIRAIRLPQQDTVHEIAIYLVNNARSVLSAVLARAEHNVDYFPELQPNAGITLLTPRLSRRLVVTYGINGNRHSLRWELQRPSFGDVQVNILAADIHGTVHVEIPPEAPVGIINAHAAEIDGDLIVKPAAPAKPYPLYPLFSHCSVGYPPAILQRYYRRLVLFSGHRLTVGCSRHCSWPISLRDDSGGIVVRTPNGQMTAFSSPEMIPSGHQQLLSRVHAMFEWHGGTAVEIRDGKHSRPSRRGVFLNSIRLDREPVSVVPPVALSLGAPSNRHLDLVISMVNVNGARSVLLESLDSSGCELVIWSLPPHRFQLMRQGAQSCVPCSSRDECELTIANSGGQWTFQAAQSSPCPLVQNQRVELMDTAYLVSLLSSDHAVLDNMAHI